LKNIKNDILTELWNSKEVNDAIKKMHPVDLQEDLKSEVFLIIAELPDDKLINLYEKGYIKFYMVRIILNLATGTDKRYYGKYRNFVEYVEKDKEDVKDIDLTEDVVKQVNNLYWYEKEILHLYAIEFNQNAKELSRAIGIPYMSIIRTINKIKQELKKNIRNDRR